MIKEKKKASNKRCWIKWLFAKKNKNAIPRVFITGDKHRDFKDIIRFCRYNRTTNEDILIILGDTGFNYFGDERDIKLKKKLSQIKITLFCIHGNKENRANNIPSYHTRNFHGGIVYYEDLYPHILFAKDCEVYDFNGKSAVVVGGAHSVDKIYRIENGCEWWEDEEPSDFTKKQFEKVLGERDNKIDYIFSHTVPYKYEPSEMFLSNKKKRRKKKKLKSKKVEKEVILDIDKTVEQWLDIIEENTTYTKWYAGHYHTDKAVDRLRIMHHDIEALDDVM